jgi:hypothetical protein
MPAPPAGCPHRLWPPTGASRRVSRKTGAHTALGARLVGHLRHRGGGSARLRRRGTPHAWRCCRVQLSRRRVHCTQHLACLQASRERRVACETHAPRARAAHARTRCCRVACRARLTHGPTSLDRTHTCTESASGFPDCLLTTMPQLVAAVAAPGQKAGVKRPRVVLPQARARRGAARAPGIFCAQALDPNRHSHSLGRQTVAAAAPRGAALPWLRARAQPRHATRALARAQAPRLTLPPHTRRGLHRCRT